MVATKLGQKYGLIAGIGMILYFLLFYFIDKKMMLGLGVSYSSLLILIPCVFISIIKQRQEQEHKISFKSGLRTGFAVIVISNVLFYLFFYVLLKIDPELVTFLKEITKEYFREYALDMEGYDEAYDNFSFGFSDVLKYLVRSLIGGFFIALLAALVLKR